MAEDLTATEVTEMPPKTPKGTPVAYRAGVEFDIMGARVGGVSYTLGTKDGLSKRIVWSRDEGQVQYLTKADAKVIEDHVREGRLQSYPRIDFVSGEDTGIIDPEFLVGQEAIDAHHASFSARYKEYADLAAELAAAPSIDVEQITA